MWYIAASVPRNNKIVVQLYCMSLQSSRLISLDALRGFTIAAMIMVNFPGNEQYVFFTLRHSKWNGFSFTDTIAPVFLFVIGVSIVFAYTKRLNDGTAKGSLYKKIIFRSFKIFFNLSYVRNRMNKRWISKD